MKIDNISNILSIPSFIVLLYATYYVPKKIMVNQIYEGLISEYRSDKIGIAILSVILFYTKTCKSNMDNIENEYIKIYKKQIKNTHLNDWSDSIHFQRRMLSQYFFQLANLRYNGFYFTRLSKRQLKKDFTINEKKLLNILYRMNIVAKKVFISYEIDPLRKEDNNELNKKIIRLYNEAKLWK
jgi:hypothetical protein